MMRLSWHITIKVSQSDSRGEHMTKSDGVITELQCNVLGIDIMLLTNDRQKGLEELKMRYHQD